VGSLFLAFHNPDSKAAAEQRIGEEGEGGGGSAATASHRSLQGGRRRGGLRNHRARRRGVRYCRRPPVGDEVAIAEAAGLRPQPPQGAQGPPAAAGQARRARVRRPGPNLPPLSPGYFWANSGV